MGCCGTEKEEPSLSNSKTAALTTGTVTTQPGQHPVLEKPNGYFQQHGLSQLPQVPNAAYQQQQSTGPQWGQTNPSPNMNEYGSFNTPTPTTFNGSTFNQGFSSTTSTSPMSNIQNLPAAMARMSQYPVEPEKDEGKMSVSIDFGKCVVFEKRKVH